MNTNLNYSFTYKRILSLVVLIAQVYFAYEWFYLVNYISPTIDPTVNPNIYIQSVWSVATITVLLLPISILILWKLIKSKYI